MMLPFYRFPDRGAITMTSKPAHAYGDNRFYPLEEELLFRPLSRPLAKVLARTPLSPTHLNVIGCLAAVGMAAAVASGATGFLPALGIYVAFLIDKLDGDLARAKGIASARGQYTDGFLDLIGDTALTAAAVFAIPGVPLWVAVMAVTGHLAFAYHGVSRPFYIGSAPSAHVRPGSSRGWRTLYRYGRAKHMLAIAVFVLVGAPALVAYPLALLWPYTVAIFLKASWSGR